MMGILFNQPPDMRLVVFSQGTGAFCQLTVWPLFFKSIKNNI